MKQWNLHDNAVVGQTLYKRVWQSLRHHQSVVVVRLVAHVENWFLDVAHPVPKKIDRHHRQGLAPIIGHVARILVLHAEILSEAQCLRL